MPAEPPAHRTFVVGDVHGQYDKLVTLLQNARLVTADLHWSGGDSTLWFIGDFCDRGPHGLAVIDLVMQLESEAAAAGGRVQSILGNHDVLLLAVDRFGSLGDEWAVYFAFQWRQNGGNHDDLRGLLPSHVQWLSQLPALAKEHGLLLMHADSPLYLDCGGSIEDVNRAFGRILSNDDADAWNWLLNRFSEHNGFSDGRPGGIATATKVLQQFGATRLIHGHTPIFVTLGVQPEDIVMPYAYANDLCINVDGCMYAGGAGFVFEVPLEWMSPAPDSAYDQQRSR